ncbi:helix-turn-helix domain-containing protein [Pannonibacter sp.]|uniref:helix-turn-helix domain-containing protein n=1 Tax=Pannonibacter sp. TaxID=1906786 RepID=UPI003F721F38
MPAIPLPFVLALLLLILLVQSLQRSGFRPTAATVFIGGCMLLTAVVGLRWTVDLPALRMLQPIVASLLPPFAWLSFTSLARQPLRHAWHHAAGPALVLILSATWNQWHPPVDLVLAGLFFGYGAALLRQAAAGADQLVDARLSDAPDARRAVVFAGVVLVGSGVVDLAIAADFDLFGGRHAASIVSIANMLTLPVIAYAIMVIGRSQPGAIEPGAPAAAEPASSPQALPDPDEDARTLSRIERLMHEQKLYRDPDLTLTRLARRAGLPARQISGAINRAHGRNVSQVVNEYRIAEAQRLLKETDQPVTTIMFDCGFQTKSNFNREFARVTGMTPSDYRRSA